MNLSRWNDALVGIAAGLVALGIIWRYIVRPAWHAVANGIKTAARVEKAVVTIEAEFKPNGGSSLRDAVNRIEAKVDNHEQRLAALEAALAALEAKLREPVISSTTTTTKIKTVEPAHIEEDAAS
jgi:hypothetical protein